MASVKVKRGDTWTFVSTWKQSGVITPLTGCTAAMQIRLPNREPAALASTSDGSITIDEPAGTVTAIFQADVTAEVSPSTNYETDVEVTFPDGTVQSSQTVYVVVEKDITRAEA